MERKKLIQKKMHFFKMLLIDDYIQLLKNTSCLIGNSSSGIRECAFIGTPVVNIGTRQNGRERAKNVIDTNHQVKNIYKAIQIQLTKGKKYMSSSIYGKGETAKKIVDKIIELKKINVQKKIRY